MCIMDVVVAKHSASKYSSWNGGTDNVVVWVLHEKALAMNLQPLDERIIEILSRSWLQISIIAYAAIHINKHTQSECRNANVRTNAINSMKSWTNINKLGSRFILPSIINY